MAFNKLMAQRFTKLLAGFDKFVLNLPAVDVK
jgi:hypothetical protein